MRRWLLATLLLGAFSLTALDLESARDKQDRAGLQTLITQLSAQADKSGKDAAAFYKVALAKSYLAEVALEQKDKLASKTAAEEGIQVAQKAVDLQPKNAEYHRILGNLCGQVIPADKNIFTGLKYGRCAMDSINKALELDPQSALAHLSRGVGNYYLPPQFGGGVPQAIKDFEKAASLNPKLADAYLWLGIALRKENKNVEARQALTKALQLSPQREWTKQQLEKTPAP